MNIFSRHIHLSQNPTTSFCVDVLKDLDMILTIQVDFFIKIGKSNNSKVFTLTKGYIYMWFLE